MARQTAAVTVAAVLLTAAMVAAQETKSDPGALTVIQVRPNFYVLKGAGGNIAVQVGPAGFILVDSGAPGTHAAVLAALSRIGGGAIRYIINTSVDSDHTGGNEQLSKAGQSIIPGNPNAAFADGVINNGGAASVLAFENVLQRMSAAGSDTPAGQWPSKVYTGARYPMYLNGDGIEVVRLPEAHTDGDSAVVFRRSDVIVAGDVLDTTRFPVIDVVRGGTIQGEIDALNRLAEITIPPFPLPWQEDRTFVIPGHGRVYDAQDLFAYRDMVTIVRDVIQDMVARGLSLEQVKAANPTKPYRRRFGAESGPWTTDMFVEAVYKTLKKNGAGGEK